MYQKVKLKGEAGSLINSAVYTQYRDISDFLETMMAMPVEKYQAMDRLYETDHLKAELAKTDEWKQSVWLPTWKADNLWPGNFSGDKDFLRNGDLEKKIRQMSV